MRGSLPTCAAVLLSVLVLSGCRSTPSAGSLIYTEVPAASGTVDWHYPVGARIVAIEPDRPGDSRRVLTVGFTSARAASPNFEGTAIVFSGKRRDGDPWRIYRIELETGRADPLTDGFERATDPSYLPDGRIVFSGVEPGSDFHALYVLDPASGASQRITWHPEDDFAPVLAQDGRLLFRSTTTIDGRSRAVLLWMRYDGTGLDTYYKHAGNGPSPRPPAMLPDRRVLVVEAETDAPGQLVTFSDGNPLHTRRTLMAGGAGSFHSVALLDSNRVVVSYRVSEDVPLALYMLRPDEEQPHLLFEAPDGSHAVEPQLLAPRTPPVGFMSIVDPQQPKSWLYCLSAHDSSLPPQTEDPATRVRVYTPDRVVGEAPLKADGSFYLELPADVPLRFETLSASGARVRGPSAWIWLRPGEQRGCIGCHESRTKAPENAAPLALTDPPIPVLQDSEATKPDSAATNG